MGWNQFGDYIDPDPDSHSSNFVDPDTINADPQPGVLMIQHEV